MELLDVSFVRNKNAKRYIIRIMPNQSIRVTIPKYGTNKEAERFLNENIDNLKKKIVDDLDSSFKYNISYLSKYYKFKIVKSKFDNNIDTINRSIIIRLSEQYEIQDKEAKVYIEFIIQQILRKEAKLYIPKRVMEFANQYKLKVTGIKINSAKTRWGSCTGLNSLNFSLHLMQLPTELIDYVILHELAHIVHKNHSSNFYNLLNKLTNGKHEVLNKNLRKYSPQIKAEYYQKV